MQQKLRVPSVNSQMTQTPTLILQVMKERTIRSGMARLWDPATLQPLDLNRAAAAVPEAAVEDCCALGRLSQPGGDLLHLKRPDWRQERCSLHA